MTNQEKLDEITGCWRRILDSLRRMGEVIGTDDQLAVSLGYVRDQMQRIDTYAVYARDLADELLVDQHNASAAALANVR